MRKFRSAALGAASLALVVSACSPGGSSPSITAPASATVTASASTGPSIASTLVLGAPPECPTRPFCAIGLKDVYGIEFKEIKPLDAGGPITVQAVKTGQVDVGLLFTSDPSIAAEGFVLLEDDLQLQKADNLIPVVRADVLSTSPALADLLNPWMGKLTQAELTALNKRVAIDQEDPEDVVRDWLGANGLETGTAGAGTAIKVGSTNFYEQEILGEVFAQVLEANGFEVERRFQLGNREIVFPALESGEIDILAEYIATALEFVNKGAGEATGDPAESAGAFRERLEALGLTALDFAPATDQNGFVVTMETAAEFGLAKLSDLANAVP